MARKKGGGFAAARPIRAGGKQTALKWIREQREREEGRVWEERETNGGGEIGLEEKKRGDVK